MQHERIRELLALRLYDELAPDERDELDRHLAGCAPCRAFGRELETGFEPLLAPTPEPVPSDWAVRMGSITSVRAARARPLTALVFAAGLAAGMLVMGLVRSPSPRPQPTPAAVPAGRFEQTTRVAQSSSYTESLEPPPRAPVRDRISRFGAIGR